MALIERIAAEIADEILSLPGALPSASALATQQFFQPNLTCGLTQ